MGAQKLTEVVIGSTPTEDTHFLITQPETVEGSKVEAVRRATTGNIKELMAGGLIAPKFSDQSTYAAGSYVLKGGILYRFTQAHSGEWTGTDAETVTVGGEVDKIIVRNTAIENHVSVSGTSKTGLYIYAGESVDIDVTNINGNVSAYIYGYTSSNVLLLSQVQKYTFTAAHDGYISFYMSSASTFEATINLKTFEKTLLDAEEQETIYNNTGLQTFKGIGNFQHYGLNTDGSFITTQKYRVSNDDPITLDYSATLKVKSGFRFGYIPFYDGTAGSWSGWYTADTIIPYGVSFVLQIARVSERTTEIASVDEFLSALSFTSPSGVFLKKKESEKNGAFVRDFNSFEHERGNITSSGGDDESEYNHTRKFRSKGLVYLNKGDIVTVSNNMRCYTVGVTLFGTVVKVNSGWITSTYEIPYSGYYRIQIGYTSDSVIADKDITKICGWVTFTSNWLLGDGEIYKYFNDSLTAGRTYAYNGEMLNFNKTTYNINEVLPVLPAKPEGSTSLQASEYYNGVMFLFYSGGFVSLVDYGTGALITSLSTGTEHGNAASFSDDFYESGDEFPLIYVASDNANNDIYVVRITRTSATIIRTLRIPVSDAGYHASNFGLDNDNRTLWTTGYKINDYQTPTGNGMYLCSWNLDSLTDNGNGIYTPALIGKSELPFIDTTQDEKVFNGNLYILSSNPYAGAQGRVSKIYVVSLNGRRISTVLKNFVEPIRDHELEGIVFIERDNKYVMGVNVVTGRRFELLF